MLQARRNSRARARPHAENLGPNPHACTAQPPPLPLGLTQAFSPYSAAAHPAAAILHTICRSRLPAVAVNLRILGSLPWKSATGAVLHGPSQRFYRFRRSGPSYQSSSTQHERRCRPRLRRRRSAPHMQRSDLSFVVWLGWLQLPEHGSMMRRARTGNRAIRCSCWISSKAQPLLILAARAHMQ